MGNLLLNTKLKNTMGHFIHSALKDLDTTVTTKVTCTGNACVKNASGGYTQNNGVSIVSSGSGNHSYSNINVTPSAKDTMKVTTTTTPAKIDLNAKVTTTTQTFDAVNPKMLILLI